MDARPGAAGVGLVYWPDLAALFEDTGLLGVLELEPQAFWERIPGPDDARYRPNPSLLEGAAQLPQSKLLHGVGQPLGGTVDDPAPYAQALRQAVDLLDPAWVSEHLSFNRRVRDGACEETGFLLPPRQSASGVDRAVRNIERYARIVDRPVAFETGVNYLRRRTDELDDGRYFGAVADAAGCGILLDLHNLWCNERNGRGRVDDVLARMPLERVWEVHLAGGMDFRGYALDAHSDVVPPALFELAARVVPRLPNLGAIVFEILPQHLSRVGLDRVHGQLLALHSLWALRRAREVAPEMLPAAFRLPADRREDDAAEWECALAAAIRGEPCDSPRFAGLGADPGIAVFRELIGDARRSALARALRYSTTLLLLELGDAATRELLDAYFAAHAPESYAAVEADRFAGFLRTRSDVLARVPHLDEVLAFEHALLRATLYAAATDLEWSSDPTAVLDALECGRRPPSLPQVHSVMRIAPG